MKFDEAVRLSKVYDERIKYLSDRITDLENMKYNAVSVLSDMPKSKGAKTSKMEGVICEQEYLREQISVLTNKSAEVKCRIFIALSEIDARTRRIVELRYFDGLNWQEVAYSMNMSIKWVQNLCNRAIPELDRAVNRK